MKRAWKRFFWWLNSRVCNRCRKRTHRTIKYGIGAACCDTHVVECVRCFKKTNKKAMETFTCSYCSNVLNVKTFGTREQHEALCMTKPRQRPTCSGGDLRTFYDER